MLKSANELSSLPGAASDSSHTSPNLLKKGTSAADLANGVDPSTSGLSTSSSSSRVQGADAVISASGFVHAAGEQVGGLHVWRREGGGERSGAQNRGGHVCFCCCNGNACIQRLHLEMFHTPV